MNNQNDTLLIDIINILSFAIGMQNLSSNEEQVKQLDEHLKKQDEQYEKIIRLLEERSNYGKQGNV